MTIATVPTTVPDLLGTAPADLIDQHADQPVATRDVAVRRAERIRAGVASYAAMRQDIADAYAQRDWRALEYDTWHAYLEGEFGEELRALTGARDVRRQAVADRRAEGMSTRQIAGALGVDQSTVVRDVQVMQPASPATVNGSDGKQHPATKPEMPARQDVADRIVAGIDQRAAAPAAAPERPKPPAWDPAERAAHEADVRRRQAIDAGHRAAGRIVAELETHVLTITAAYRYGEKNLITPETIANLRAAIDRLEAEL